MASLKWSEDALHDLGDIDAEIARRIVEKVKWLGENFSGVVPENLHHDLEGKYKLRVGDYRVVYTAHEDLIIVQAVGHRKDVYK